MRHVMQALLLVVAPTIFGCGENPPPPMPPQATASPVEPPAPPAAVQAAAPPPAVTATVNQTQNQQTSVTVNNYNNMTALILDNMKDRDHPQKLGDAPSPSDVVAMTDMFHKAKILPPQLNNATIPAPSNHKTAIVGDPRIDTRWGHVNYKDKAIFIFLDRDGIQGMLYVDVYLPLSDVISDVWRCDGSTGGNRAGTWRHRHIPKSNNTATVPLDTTAALPLSKAPSQDVLDQFLAGLTWLVFEGSVIPGPDPLLAYEILKREKNSPALKQFNANSSADLLRRNYLSFELADASFHTLIDQSPGQMFSHSQESDYLRVIGADILAGFVLADRSHP